MKINLLKAGALIANSAGIGTVNRSMVWNRAIALALMDGRTARDVSSTDWEQAKQELTGQSNLDPEEEILEAAPESERWDPVPGSTGQKVETAASEDEDADGRSDNEILVEQGIDEADLDHAKASSRQDS